jgi:hypothetical protein
MALGTDEGFAQIQQQQGQQQAELQSDIDKQQEETAQGPINASTAAGGASVATQPAQQGQPQQGQQPQQMQGQPQQPQQGQGQQGQPAQPQPPAHAGKAGLFRSIFETLAGPPTPKYKIDPNTGSMVPYYVDPKTGQQLDKPPARSVKQLSNSIVAGALTGMLAGEEAPVGSPMGGFARGFQATQAQAQQRNQQAKQEANQDMIRKQSIAEGNYKLHQLGTQTAAMDMKFNQDINDANEDSRKELREAGALKEDDIKEEDIPAMMKKYNIGRDSFMRVGQIYPHLGPDGQPLKNPDGSMMLSSHYAIIDPNAEVTVTPQVLKVLHAGNNHKFDKLEGGPAIKAHLLNQAKVDAQAFRALGITGDGHQEQMQVAPQTPATPSTLKLPGKAALPDNSSALAEKYAAQYNVDPNLVKALMYKESQGDPKAVSPKGAVGLMQLMPKTAADLKVNPSDPEQNVEGGVRYLAKLLKDNNGDITKALAAYNSGRTTPDNPETKDYVKSITSWYTPGEEAKPAASTKPAEPSFSEKLEAGLKDGSITEDMAKQWVRFSLGRTPEEARKVMLAGGVPAPVVGKFVELNGGLDAIQAHDSQIKAKEAAMKSAASAAATLPIKEQEAEFKLSKEQELQKEQQSFLETPVNFKLDPNAPTMEPQALQSYLQTQGVKVPKNFAALYAVGHNQADLKTLPQKTYKGTATMDTQTGLAYIRNFINPQYNEGDYPAAANLNKEIASTRQGTAGGALMSAGVAANHTQLLGQLAPSLRNGDIQAWNKLANAYNVQIGKGDVPAFRNVAQQVTNEVAKVVSGNTALESELKQQQANLNTAESPKQIADVLDSSIRLMAGRINEIDDRSMQYFGRHVKGISPTMAITFGIHGLEVGGYGKPVFDKPANDPNKQLLGFANDQGQFNYKVQNGKLVKNPNIPGLQ